MQHPFLSLLFNLKTVMVVSYSFAETMVLVHFVIIVLLWLTRDPGIFPGWRALLSHK